jgi:hypothetical protein
MVALLSGGPFPSFILTSNHSGRFDSDISVGVKKLIQFVVIVTRTPQRWATEALVVESRSASRARDV